MPLLEVDDLSMSFADKKLYEGASFTLEKGEHMGVVGQNGVGKSTLIKIITGQELPLTGSVKWQKKTHIGYLDQYADIPDGMTLIDFLHTAYADLYEMNDRMTAMYTGPAGFKRSWTRGTFTTWKRKLNGSSLG